MRLLVAGLGLASVLGLGTGPNASAATPPHGPCPDRFTGSGWRDVLEGGRGTDCLDGGAGNDSLAGGPGGDTLRGGPGDDQILPGAGADRIEAGRGDDLVFARDGNAESVICGPGRDVVSADVDDTLRGCEEVSLAAPEVSWFQFHTHINAYGFSRVGRGNDGYCDGDSYDATCKGTAEVGNFPFSAGQQIRMEWERSGYGGSEIVTIKAPQTDSILVGRTDLGWTSAGFQVTAGWVGQWIDPNHGVIRTGVGGAPGTQGGPLSSYLSYHSFNAFEARKNGYSLDLRGWLKYVFIA